ncbi:MAG: hypothetical protein C5B57_04870 [Blastocatellia bacterium]|nr:MAG: hypothetical protein C5B57_04870 [Blastocatellia bacterium]
MGGTESAPQQAERSMRRGWILSIGCALWGHDDMLHRAPGRLFLRCERCSRETAGWLIETSTRITPAIAACRPRMSVISRGSEISVVQETLKRAASPDPGVSRAA